MKFASVILAIATVALVSVDRASAVSTCSEADAQKILLLTNQIFSDANCLAAMNDECPGAACFATLEKVAKQMPSCMAGGTNPKTTFEQLLKNCKATSVGGGSSTTTTTTTTTPTITTTTTTTPTITTTTKTPSATTKIPLATTDASSDTTATTATPSAATTAPSGIIISPNAGTNTGTSAAAGRSSCSLSAGVLLSFAMVATAFL